MITQSITLKCQKDIVIDNHGDILDEIDKKLNLARFSVDDDGNLIYTDDSSYDFMVDENGNLNWEVKTNG